jgi:hypothetical protein
MCVAPPLTLSGRPGDVADANVGADVERKNLRVPVLHTPTRSTANASSMLTSCWGLREVESVPVIRMTSFVAATFRYRATISGRPRWHPRIPSCQIVYYKMMQRSCHWA